jgi:hypothetical protein
MPSPKQRKVAIVGSRSVGQYLDLLISYSTDGDLIRMLNYVC